MKVEDILKHVIPHSLTMFGYHVSNLKIFISKSEFLK